MEGDNDQQLDKEDPTGQQTHKSKQQKIKSEEDGEHTLPKTLSSIRRRALMCCQVKRKESQPGNSCYRDLQADIMMTDLTWSQLEAAAQDGEMQVSPESLYPKPKSPLQRRL